MLSRFCLMPHPPIWNDKINLFKLSDSVRRCGGGLIPCLSRKAACQEPSKFQGKLVANSHVQSTSSWHVLMQESRMEKIAYSNGLPPRSQVWACPLSKCLLGWTGRGLPAKFPIAVYNLTSNICPKNVWYLSQINVCFNVSSPLTFQISTESPCIITKCIIISTEHGNQRAKVGTIKETNAWIKQNYTSNLGSSRHNTGTG